ncbi:hypothetical protein WICPIJ_002010 [Wickerhamomyces pijperi]|uniref:HhH-GPD domain-containing protein n=1 Tax=Wickerhamomyces pijperi TaxID=599730 RepID=A0A9P8TQ22_WICPI|nr:hypothetical protein WICPIJ_002010 [Wickerhamomyces pijperi]
MFSSMLFCSISSMIRLWFSGLSGSWLNLANSALLSAPPFAKPDCIMDILAVRASLNLTGSLRAAIISGSLACSCCCICGLLRSCCLAVSNCWFIIELPEPVANELAVLLAVTGAVAAVTERDLSLMWKRVPSLNPNEASSTATATASIRTLRSSRRKLKSSAGGESIGLNITSTATDKSPLVEVELEAEATELTPITKKRKTTKAAVNIKYDFKQFEKDLAEKYPIPTTKPIKLPEVYTAQHKPEFIAGLEFIITKDPSLYPLIIHEPFSQFHVDSESSTTTQQHFERICRSIIGQQISGSAALAVEKKFKSIYQDKYPTPEQILLTSSEDLRNAGLSVRKAEYVKSAAEFFTNEQDLDFDKLTNDEIIEKLIKIKGIAEWSAIMFLAFSLKRLDVFAIGDLGVARGVSRYIESRPHILDQLKAGNVQLKKSKFDDKKKRDWKVINDAYVELFADEFKPYRTVLMMIMWRASATNIEVLS